MRVPFWALIVAVCASAACSGAIDDAGGTARATDGARPARGESEIGSDSPNAHGADPGVAGSTAPGDQPAGALDVGRSPLRRLGKSELLNTLHDLLPMLPKDFDAKVELPADNVIQLAFALPGTVSDLEVKRFMDLAESAVAALAADGVELADCSGQDETECARAFVNSFGKRAFRRPLDSAEADASLALFTKLRTDAELKYDVQEALGVVVEAMLQSPGFLYRWERGLQAPQRDGELVKFDDYEIASRLSYFLWNSMPDAALLAAADAGELETVDQIAVQARRLLADPRADATLADFIAQWLELQTLPDLIKDSAVYPEFTPDLRASMQRETLAFSRDVLRGASPTFSNLLTARYTFVDEKLAAYYGVRPDADGRVDLTGSARLGLLTQGSVMAVKGNSYRTSPVRRGKFILNRMLCSSVPPPPPNVVPELPPPDPNLTLREQMAMHRDSPSCASCHATMDPLGFAFEFFDGAGNYRKDDGGHVIDASGSVLLDGATVEFSDASELATALAASQQARECFARQWLRYAIDRFEQPEDDAAMAELVASYEKSGFDTRELIVGITRGLPFSHRAPAAGEDLTP